MVWANGGWLDDSLQVWNAPGQPIAQAPPDEGSNDDPRCLVTVRPPESSEDETVFAAGWTLFGTYEGGWGVRLVKGLVGFDGMCRPWSYQFFVFVDGDFAGTVSPVPMSSRTDGAAGQVFLYDSGEQLTAQFARYAETDPLCCPSRTSSVRYRIERGDPGPSVVPLDVFTAPN
jgi:hypothetical protein